MKEVEILREKGEVLFSFKEKYIYIQERTDGSYEGDIYESEAAFDNGEDPIDGGICETNDPETAIQFFKEGL
jgi:hypothetical protein